MRKTGSDDSTYSRCLSHIEKNSPISAEELRVWISENVGSNSSEILDGVLIKAIADREITIGANGVLRANRSPRD